MFKGDEGKSPKKEKEETNGKKISYHFYLCYASKEITKATTSLKIMWN